MRRTRFFIGILIGIFVVLIIIAYLKFFSRFLGIKLYIFLGLGNIISGFVAGDDIKEGAKTGFLCGVVQAVILITYGMISDFPSYSSLTLFELIAGLLASILEISFFTVLGGAIGGGLHLKSG